MSRGISAGAITLLENGFAHLAALLKVEFGTPIYITDQTFQIPYGGNTYVPSSSLLDLADVKETTEVRVNQWSFTVSGTDSFWYAALLGGNITDIPVTYYLAILDSSRSVEDAIQLFTGSISGAKIQENANRSRIRVNCAGEWADYLRPSGCLTSPEDHEQYFPGDGDFFEFAQNPLSDRTWTIRDK